MDCTTARVEQDQDRLHPDADPDTRCIRTTSWGANRSTSDPGAGGDLSGVWSELPPGRDAGSTRNSGGNSRQNASAGRDATSLTASLTANLITRVIPLARGDEMSSRVAPTIYGL